MQRIYGLDIVRAAAILFVIIGHSTAFLPYTIAKGINFFIFDGVSIFFVLSGYLIGGILIKHLEDEKPFINFWWRRWRRTLPNYFFTLFLLTYITYGSFKIDFDYLFFIQNLEKPHPDFFPEAWSLSIEEWFYIVSPMLVLFLIFIMKKRNDVELPIKKSFIITAIALLLFSLVFRFIKYSVTDVKNLYNWDVLFRKQVITRLDSIAVGLIGAFITRYYYNLWVRYKKPLFITGMAGMTATMMILRYIDVGMFSCVFYFTLIAVFTLFTFPYLTEIKTGKGIIFQMLTFISIISYSMYLLNYSLILNILLPHLTFNFHGNTLKLVQLLEFWGLTIILSTITYFLIEKTFMKERKPAII